MNCEVSAGDNNQSKWGMSSSSCSCDDRIGNSVTSLQRSGRTLLDASSVTCDDTALMLAFGVEFCCCINPVNLAGALPRFEGRSVLLATLVDTSLSFGVWLQATLGLLLAMYSGIVIVDSLRLGIVIVDSLRLGIVIVDSLRLGSVISDSLRSGSVISELRRAWGAEVFDLLPKFGPTEPLLLTFFPGWVQKGKLRSSQTNKRCFRSDSSSGRTRTVPEDTTLYWRYWRGHQN